MDLRDALHTGTACLRCGVGTVTLDAQKAGPQPSGLYRNVVPMLSAPTLQNKRRTTDLSKIAPPLGGDGLHQRGDLDRREIGEGVGDGIGQNNLIAMPHGATGVDDVGHVTFTLVGSGWSKGSRERARTLDGSLLSKRTAPIEYLLTGPTPWISSSQQSSNSMGQPQLPICTNPRGIRAEEWIGPPPMNEGRRNRSDKIFVVLAGDHRIAAIDLLGNSAMPLLRAADPVKRRRS